MNAASDSREKRRRRLLQQIKEEERLIRIYEADYKVIKSRKRTRGAAIVVSDKEEDDNWLTALDALQSQDATANLDTRWHDDPLMYRILPHVGGIAFRSAKPVGTTRNEGVARYRCYEFEGSVCENDNTDDASVTMTKVDFCITIEVEFRDGAQISKVGVTIPFSEQQEELRNIVKVVEETRNVPLLFRQLINWARFDYRRNQFLTRFIVADQNMMERLSPTIIRIHWRSSGNKESHLDIRWQWEVSWATSGKDVLEIHNCRVAWEPLQPLAAAISRSKTGMPQLIESVGGSCEKALDIVLQAICRPIKSGSGV